jgi:hypothetical protein
MTETVMKYKMKRRRYLQRLLSAGAKSGQDARCNVLEFQNV